MTTSSAAPAITVAAAILMILMFRFMSHPSIRQFNAGDLLEIYQGLLVNGQLLVVVDFVFEDRLEIREQTFEVERARLIRGHRGLQRQRRLRNQCLRINRVQFFRRADLELLLLYLKAQAAPGW